MGLGSSEWGPCCIRILDYAHFPNYIIIQVFAVRPHGEGPGAYLRAVKQGLFEFLINSKL